MFKKKFENVNVIDVFDCILFKNTVHYRNDFDYDKEMIKRASSSERAEDKTLLWMCRPCGTYCFTEYEVFQSGTPANTTWTYYGNTDSKGILAFVVELKGENNGIIIGDIYPVDFQKHIKLVEQKSICVGEVEIDFKDAVRMWPYQEYTKQMWTIFDQYGNGEEFHYIPSKPEELEALLQMFRLERQKAKKCSADRYIDTLTVRKA